jgi:hypothetical protein
MFPIIVILLLLLVLGTYLIIRSFHKIRHFDKTIEHLKKHTAFLKKLSEHCCHNKRLIICNINSFF